MDIVATTATTDRRTFLTAGAFVLTANAVGAAPALVVGADSTWFERPWFYPPELLFPVVWTVLFSLMGVAAFLVWRQGLNQRPVKLALAAFVGQFALNLAWTPVFFGAQRPDLGLAVVIALAMAIVATILAFDRVDRRAALLLVPYLLWVGFATVLNAAIWLQ